MRAVSILAGAVLILLVSAYTHLPLQFFSKQRAIATIRDERLVEASGLEESFANPGYFWTHNDSGGDPSLFLIDRNGNIEMEVVLDGMINRDWEEIITVKQGDRSSIYVAEIGDNQAVHNYVSLICLEEPVMGVEKRIVKKDRIKVMNFRYAEGARDAEASFYDYNTGEFVLITKRESRPLVYSFSFQESEEPVVIQSRGSIPKSMYTAADMNQEGEILLKHYSAIFYWPASTQPAVDRILAWNPISIDYVPEPQGEAICWLGRDFYTISEKNEGKPQEMMYFQRLR